MSENLMSFAQEGVPLKNETVIDMHGHIGPYFNFAISDNDAEGMMKSMDRVGVDFICISGHAGMGPGTKIANEIVRETVDKYPQRFRGYLFINPHYPDDTKWQLESAKQLGFEMIKLHPSSHAYPVNGERYKPVWEYVNDNKAIILVHTWTGTPQCEPRMFVALSQEYPGARIILGHSGGTVNGFDNAIEIANANENIYLDLTGSAFLHYGVIEKFVKKANVDKLLFGSDLPFIGLPSQIGKILYAKISDDDKRKILGLNAQRLLG